MSSQWRPAFACFLLLTILTGVLYPAFVTAVAGTLFAHQANGSLITIDGQNVGSELIGQPFSDDGYFWSRPSATLDANGKPLPYNGLAGAGSNQSPTNPALVEAVKQRIAALRAADPANDTPVPVDLVTASASGLDPHISPAAADYQVARVAAARHVDPAKVRAVVERHTEGRTLGVLGMPRVNVLALNLALDHPKFDAPPPPPATRSSGIKLYRWSGVSGQHR